MKQCKQCNKEAAPSRALCLDCINKKNRAEAKEKAKLAKEKKANRDAIKKERDKLKKQTSTKTLDALWAKAVKILANYTCEVCGSSDFLQSHHYFGRKAYQTRFDVKNGFCLCPGHHNYNNQLSAHNASPAFVIWAIKQRGQAWHDELEKRVNSVKKLTDEDREIFRKELLAIIAEKEGEE